MPRQIESGNGGQQVRPQSFREGLTNAGKGVKDAVKRAGNAFAGKKEDYRLTIAELERIGADTQGILSHPEIIDPETGAIKQQVVIQFKDHTETDIAEKSAEERALELLVPGHKLVGDPNGDIYLARTDRSGNVGKTRMRDLPRLYRRAETDPENKRTLSATFTSLKLDAVSAANFGDPIAKARSIGKSGAKHALRGGISTYAPLKDTILSVDHPQKVPAESHGIKGAAVLVFGSLSKWAPIAVTVDSIMLAKNLAARVTGRNLYSLRPLGLMTGFDSLHGPFITPGTGYSLRRAIGLYQTVAKQERAQDMRFALEDFDYQNPEAKLTDKQMQHLKGYTQLSENLWRSVIGHWKSRPEKAERKFVNEVRKANNQKPLRRGETADLTFGEIDRANMPKYRQDAYYEAKDLRRAFHRAQEILDARPDVVQQLKRW